MKPVMQTLFGKGKGNCYAACIASILEIPIEDVPNFCAQSQYNWHKAVADWMSVRGLRIIALEFSTRKGLWGGEALKRCWTYGLGGEWVILSGLSPRSTDRANPMYHSVVGQPRGWGFRMVHDPHPDGTGLRGHPWGVEFIVPVGGPLRTQAPPVEQGKIGLEAGR